MSIERWKLDRSPSSYRLGLVADRKGDWVKYKDVVRIDAECRTHYINRIKTLDREIEKHLDARFVACESHVVTMGKLLEAQARIESLEATIRQQHVQQVVNEQKLIDIRCVLLHSKSTSDERMKIDRILQK